MHCVDANIVWAVAYDGTDVPAPCQDFTKTIDGGNWTPGFINGADGLRSAMIFALDANKAWVPMYAAAGGVQGIYYTSDGGSQPGHVNQPLYLAILHRSLTVFISGMQMSDGAWETQLGDTLRSIQPSMVV